MRSRGTSSPYATTSNEIRPDGFFDKSSETLTPGADYELISTTNLAQVERQSPAGQCGICTRTTRAVSYVDARRERQLNGYKEF